MDSLRAT